MAQFQQNPLTINAPVSADAGSILSATQQVGQADINAASTMGKVASGALDAGGKLLTSKFEQSVEDVLKNTVADNGFMGENAMAMKAAEMKGTIFTEQTDVAPEQAPAQVKDFNRQTSTIEAAKNSGILSGEEATARITTLQKKFIAMYPGMADTFRKAAVDTTERAMYGNRGVYNLLVSEELKKAALKQQNEYEDAFKKWAWPMYQESLNNPNVYANARRQYAEFHTLANDAKMAENAVMAEEKKNQYATVATVGPAVAANSNLLRTAVTEEVKKAGLRFDSLINTPDAAKAGIALTQELQGKLSEMEVREMQMLRSTVSKVTERGGRIDPKWVAEQEKNITEYYKGLKASHETPEAAKAYAALAKVSETEVAMAKNNGQMLDAVALAFPDMEARKQAYSFMAVATQNGIDVTADPAELPKEQQTKLNAYMKTFGIGATSLDYFRQRSVAAKDKVVSIRMKAEQDAAHNPDGSLKSLSEISALAGEKTPQFPYGNSNKYAASLVEQATLRPVPKKDEEWTKAHTTGVALRSVRMSTDATILPMDSNIGNTVKGLVSTLNKDRAALLESGKATPEEKAAIESNHRAALLAILTGKDSNFSIAGYVGQKASSYIGVVKVGRSGDGLFTVTPIEQGVTSLTSNVEAIRARDELVPYVSAINSALTALKGMGVDTSKVTTIYDLDSLQGSTLVPKNTEKTSATTGYDW